MKVELIHNTPLWVASKAIRKCWASEDKSDTHVEAECACCNSYYLQNEGCTVSCPECECDEYRLVKVAGEKDKELIYRVGNKNKHKSTLEHLVYTFDIDGISRACLQEVARHRMASYSVKSTRYTLKELKDADLNFKENNGEADKFLVRTCDDRLDYGNRDALVRVQVALLGGLANDKAKYMLPEAYKTSLVLTVNARSLQNFLELRTSNSALWLHSTMFAQ